MVLSLVHVYSVLDFLLLCKNTNDGLNMVWNMDMATTFCIVLYLVCIAFGTYVCTLGILEVELGGTEASSQVLRTQSVHVVLFGLHCCFHGAFQL